MRDRRERLSGSYRCRNIGGNRIVSVGILAGIVMGSVIAGNAMAADRNGFRAETKLSARESHKQVADAASTSVDQAALRSELGKQLAAGNGNSDGARVLAEKLSDLQPKSQASAREARTASKNPKMARYPARKGVNEYALLNGKELKTAVAKLLCQSGECPTQIEGKTAAPFDYPQKQARSSK